MRRCRFTGVMTGLVLALLGAVAAEGWPAPPAGGLHRVQRGEPLDPCPPAAPGAVVRESRGVGFTVDACGRRVGAKGELVPFAAGPGKTAAHITIDSMTSRLSFAYHNATGPFTVLGGADVYSLSDGSQWWSGAGSYSLGPAALDHVEVSGTALRFVLAPPPGGQIYQQTDYDSGDHSAQGTLAAAGPLVLEATAGATTAVLHGKALLVANDATWYGEPRFNYYSAVVGSVVPFEMTYTLQNDTWTADVFSRSFQYSATGSVDFAHPVSTPHPLALTIFGPPRVPDEQTFRYTAVVDYEGGARKDVSASATWSVDPAALASVAGGLLTIGTLPGASADLTLRASYTEGADSLEAVKTVHCLADDPAEAPGTWPMYQANARHTGYLGMAFQPERFRFKWRRDLGQGHPLNPVAAGDGKVFATLLLYFNDVTSLFALDANDGTTLWSKGFGSIFSVNPPSYAYGSVYVQTGDHADNTWLHAYDGATGDVVFEAPHAAQWERYFAPTIYDGKAYVNGGYYGGMYGFDAYSGEQLWFADLPQYDEWTPAVDAGRAYAYVGEYNPGLYGKDRATGAQSLFVADPHFDWNGWSMNLAPVLGDHGDAIAIHNGRLLSFDTALGTLRWEVQGGFSGQPSVAHDAIYAIDGGRLRVLDELTHAELWSWQAPDGDLTGTMIVTDTHVLASTATHVYAVGLTAHRPVWSYPVGGQLALADGTLYVAGSDGVLTALAAPPPASFYTVTPCRVVDTRGTSGAPVGGPALSGGVLRTLHIAGQCGVPATALAVSVNVTVTGAGAPGNVRLDAFGDPASVFSNLNYEPGQTRANNAVLALDPNGDLTALAAQAAGAPVHLIIDVNGYFQ